MLKTITKIGNSQGLMLDSALMDLAHLKVGDQVRIRECRPISRRQRWEVMAEATE